MKKILTLFLALFLIPVLVSAQGTGLEIERNLFYAGFEGKTDEGSDLTVYNRNKPAKAMDPSIANGINTVTFRIDDRGHYLSNKSVDGTDNKALVLEAKSDATGNDRYLQLKTASTVGTGRLLLKWKAYFSEVYDGVKQYILLNDGSSRKLYPFVLSSGEKADAEKECFEITKNEWYDITMEMTPGSKIVKLTVDGLGTIDIELASAFNAFSYIRLHLLYTPTNTGFIAFDDVSLTHYIEQGTISSINSGNDVNYGSDALSIQMSSLPENLQKEHIEITDGTKTIGIKELTTDTNTINLKLSSVFESATDYTLTIKSDAFIKVPAREKASTLSDGFSSKAQDFEMYKPAISVSNGEASFLTRINNVTGTDEPVSLIAVIYQKDDSGINRIIGIKSASYIAAAGETPVWIDSVPVDEKTSIKLFVTNGWQKRKPVFGKTWSYTSDDIANVN